MRRATITAMTLAAVLACAAPAAAGTDEATSTYDLAVVRLPRGRAFDGAQVGRELRGATVSGWSTLYGTGTAHVVAALRGAGLAAPEQHAALVAAPGRTVRIRSGEEVPYVKAVVPGAPPVLATVETGVRLAVTPAVTGDVVVVDFARSDLVGMVRIDGGEALGTTVQPHTEAVEAGSSGTLPRGSVLVRVVGRTDADRTVLVVGRR